MADRPDSIEEMHEQDWLLVIEALMHYASPVDPQSGAFRDVDPFEITGDPRRGLAFELAAFFSEVAEIPEGDVEDHIDREWDGSNR